MGRLEQKAERDRSGTAVLMVQTEKMERMVQMVTQVLMVILAQME